MKRLILRIAALGTVVVLGLIAIAQAQRGSEDPVDIPDNPLRTADARPAANPEPRRIDPADVEASPLRGPVLAPVNAEEKSPLRETPTQVSADNPLRGAAQLASATAEVPATPVGAGNGPMQVEVAPPSAAPKLGPPLGLERPVGPASPLDPAKGLAMAGASDPPAQVGAAAAAPGMENRFPQTSEPVPPSTGGGGSGFGPPPADIGRGGLAKGPANPLRGAPSADEALAAGPSIPPAGEPAPFRMDSAADATSIPPVVPPMSNLPVAKGAEPLPGAPAGMADGSGQPGAKHLEGPQSPQLTIHKTAPAEIQVGKNAVFEVTVRNVGSIAAGGVEIRDRVPKGTRLVGTTPTASQGPQGELVWALGSLEPGGETTVEMQVIPNEEGEIGSVATVSFSTDASVRTTCTRPQLALRCTAEDKVLIGDRVTLKIELSNPGTGVATGVVLAEHVPAGLRHAAGSDLEYEVGTLAPGESRKLELTLEAARAGQVSNLLAARAEGNLQIEEHLDLEIIAPELDLAMQGPTRRFLEREAVYELSVHNPGTASAEGVELVAYLPEGLKFVSANNHGHYDSAKGAVHWQLAELPVAETGTVQLVTMPVRSGQQKIRLEGKAAKGLHAEQEHPVSIEGIAAIMFAVADVTDPVGIGGETTYEIRVVNQGTKAADNVRLAIDLPPELTPVAAEGPTRNTVEGNRVLFEPLARLAPKADTTYRVRAKALRPGDLRIRAQLLTDDLQSPVVKEESTRVYSDE